MVGSEVFKIAVTKLGQAVDEALAANQLVLRDTERRRFVAGDNVRDRLLVSFGGRRVGWRVAQPEIVAIFGMRPLRERGAQQKDEQRK